MRSVAGRRQRSHVMCQERQRSSTLNAPTMKNREVGRVREPLPVEGGHLRAVERRDALGRQRRRRVVLEVFTLGEALAEDCCGDCPRLATAAASCRVSSANASVSSLGAVKFR